MQNRKDIVQFVPKAVLDKLEVDADTYLTLRNSVFPGAKDESIHLALAYCRASQLDILQKPVHIVPMSIKNPNTGSFEFRDTIMPGITLYRIQASRSGAYAGKEEPEYGPDITEFIQGTSITYPLWCRVTVKKLVNGITCHFTAKEFWKENYATKKGGEVNAMWLKRPYAQLAKCAEAQALRMAWPELIGGIPTAEEMEGKSLDGTCEIIEPSKDTLITQDELELLKGKIEEAEAQEINICAYFQIDTIESMTQKNFFEMMRRLQKQIDKNQKSNGLAINQAFAME